MSLTELSPDDFDEFAISVKELVSARSKSESAAVRLIVVEGENGAGKTTLAARLAGSFDATHVKLDDYLRPRSQACESFVDLVDVAAFSAAIQDAPLVVADGVLISDVLARAELASDYSVYVKRISEYGFWNYGFELARGSLVEIPSLPPSMLDNEIFEYHLRRLPHECANVVFHRVG